MQHTCTKPCLDLAFYSWLSAVVRFYETCSSYTYTHTLSLLLQEVANTLWAFATLREAPGLAVQDGLCFRALSLFRLNSTNFLDLDVGEGDVAARLGQIHQFMLSCELDKKMRPASEKDRISLGLQALKADLGSACRNAFLSTSVSPSRFQRDVAATLKAMGMLCEEEAVDPLSGYTIDILLRSKAGGRMFALEVDGESFIMISVALRNAV
jgi:hypothetical protein